MGKTFELIQARVLRNEILISAHGYDELAQDNILVQDILVSFHEALVVEDYPDYAKGPCVLVLQRDHDEKPIHVLWGIPKGKAPAVIITAYRPDPAKWTDDFMRRKK